MEMSCIKLKLVSYYKLFTISKTLNCHDVIELCKLWRDRRTDRPRDVLVTCEGRLRCNKANPSGFYNKNKR